jgi:hypothetical protein
LGDGSGAPRAEPWLDQPEIVPWVEMPQEPPVEEKPSGAPPGAKPGVLQRISLQETWIAPGGPNGLGMNDIGGSLTLGLPFFTVQSPLLITPGFTAHFTEGPQTVDVPPRLYDASLDLRHLRRLAPRWMMDLAVTPGVFSDFDQDSGDGFRMTGRALAIYEPNPQAKWILGVVYLNRVNVKLLPVAGVLWTPNDDMRWELIMPQPRIARRVKVDATGAWWGYVGGEFGGGVWAVTRADDAADVLTINDYRLRLGIERKTDSGHSAWLELGYIFWRTLEYESVGATQDLSDAMFVRVGAAY